MNRVCLALLALILAAGCGPAPAAKPQTQTAAPAEPTPAKVDSAQPASAAAPAESAKKAAVAAPKPEGTLTDTLTAASLPENLFMTIKVKNQGTMKVRFYTKDAPMNVTNVANLAIKGFYNGLTFHRLIPGFMIQGGDPKGTGAGDIGYTVPAEIKRKHLKGTVAMARTGDAVNPKKASSGCQFYICFAPAPFLDGQYTAIGELIDGTPVLEKLEKVPTGAQDRPLTPVIMELVTVTAK